MELTKKMKKKLNNSKDLYSNRRNGIFLLLPTWIEIYRHSFILSNKIKLNGYITYNNNIKIENQLIPQENNLVFWSLENISLPRKLYNRIVAFQVYIRFY